MNNPNICTLIGPRHQFHSGILLSMQQSIGAAKVMWVRSIPSIQGLLPPIDHHQQHHHQLNIVGAVVQQSTPVLYQLQLLSTCPVQRADNAVWHCQFPRPFIHSAAAVVVIYGPPHRHQTLFTVLHTAARSVIIIKQMRYSDQIKIAPKCHTVWAPAPHN